MSANPDMTPAEPVLQAEAGQIPPEGHAPGIDMAGRMAPGLLLLELLYPGAGTALRRGLLAHIIPQTSTLSS